METALEIARNGIIFEESDKKQAIELIEYLFSEHKQLWIANGRFLSIRRIDMLRWKIGPMLRRFVLEVPLDRDFADKNKILFSIEPTKYKEFENKDIDLPLLQVECEFRKELLELNHKRLIRKLDWQDNLRKSGYFGDFAI